MRNDDLESKNQELGKSLEDQNQRISMLRLENESLRSQSKIMEEQYRDIFGENDYLKSEVLRLKESVMEVESNCKTSQMSLDRINVERKQLNEALKRTESALEVITILLLSLYFYHIPSIISIS